jgi:hypothetical protein
VDFDQKYWAFNASVSTPPATPSSICQDASTAFCSMLPIQLLTAGPKD